MKIYRYLCIMLPMILAISCTESNNQFLKPELDNQELDNQGLDIWSIEFDPTHKTFWLDIKIKEEMATSPAMIDQMNVQVTELDMDMKEVEKDVQPKLVGMHNIISDYIGERGQNALIIADLTLSKKEVKQQMILTSNLREIFPNNSLYIAFIKGSEISETYPVTNYVIDSMFVDIPDKAGEKMLYRAMKAKIDEMNGIRSKFYPSVSQDTIWKAMTNEQKVLIVFSDGRTYTNGQPIDPLHFELQQHFVNEKDTAVKFPIFYVNYINEGQEDFDMENNAESLMSILTHRTGGEFITTKAWLKLTRYILALGEDSCADTRLMLTNPDYKVYRGKNRWLKVEFINSDTVYASGYKHYALGSVYSPIIVNGITDWQIIIQGVGFFIFLLLIIYIVFQYIVPWIKYRIFRKKYVTKYSGRNMSFNGVQIDEVCYFCKAPFRQDDEIVVKCEHVMHQSCWDENEYKCPEYGRKCPKGSHYYNSHKLYDPRNAPYYIKWLLAGACAGALAWLWFVLNFFRLGHKTLSEWVSSIPTLTFDGVNIDYIMQSRFDDLSHTPYFGLYICFFLTLFLSVLSSQGKWWWKRMVLVTVKAIVAGLCGFSTFVIAAIIKHVFNISVGALMIDWIPWTLNGFMVAYAVSLYTDIKLSKAILGAMVSIAFGLGSMLIFDYSIGAQTDSRDLLLISSLIYSMGLAISLASQSPQIEKYFIRIEGPIKTMEVALYKWMKSQTAQKRVTIGKSVNCNLQMSWDINSQIAPIHAELVSSQGDIYLIARKEGVMQGTKQVAVDKRIRLHHGDKFSIGQTLFTYIEHYI